MSNTDPNPTSNLVKVVFDLERDENDYPPADFEYLWAKPIGGNLYVLDNTPFFVRGVSTGDTVIAEPDSNDELRYRAVAKPSQHTTLRVVVFRESPDPRPIGERIRDLRQQLDLLGCSTELSHLPGLVAVDVPPGVLLSSLISMLEAGEARELWEYEEAALRE